MIYWTPVKLRTFVFQKTPLRHRKGKAQRKKNVYIQKNDSYSENIDSWKSIWKRQLTKFLNGQKI